MESDYVKILGDLLQFIGDYFVNMFEKYAENSMKQNTIAENLIASHFVSMLGNIFQALSSLLKVQSGEEFSLSDICEIVGNGIQALGEFLEIIGILREKE